MNVMEAARRLESFLSSMAPPPTRPSSPFRGVTTPSQPSSSSYSSWSEKIYNLLISKPDTSSNDIPKIEKNRITHDIERLKTIGDVISSIWEIHVDLGENAMVGESRTHAGEDVFQSPFVEEETHFLPVGPNVFAPHSHVKNQLLTSRGREQIKRGFRKCSNMDIPIIPSQRAKTLIRTFEIKFLVELSLKVSLWLDVKVFIFLK